MEEKKIIKNNITYHLIKTNRFKQISIVLFFTKEFKKEDIPFSYLLINNMMYSSLKYNSKDKISSASEDLFGLKATSAFTINGKCECICFSLDFLNPKYTEEHYLEDSVEYFSEIILNPNVKNNEFNNEYFNIIKNDTISTINAIKDDPSRYAGINYAKIMYENTPTSFSTVPTLEDVNKVNPKNLYDFYKKLFSGEYKVNICILGDVSDDIVNVINNRFGSIKSNSKKMTFTINHLYKNKIKEKIDSLEYNQSKLYIGYRILNPTYHELNHVAKVYNTILGTMNDSVLFNIVREENSLCYSIGSYVNKYNPSITIYAGINKDNYEKTIDLVKKCVDGMNSKKVIERLFDSAKKTINTFLNNYYDDSVAQINNYYLKEFETIDDIETLRENINNVTIDEVIEFNKKVKLSCIYMLKGEKNE